jgi:hypothetical protein
MHNCAKAQPCSDDQFTCENGRCINKVSINKYVYNII